MRSILQVNSPSQSSPSCLPSINSFLHSKRHSRKFMNRCRSASPPTRRHFTVLFNLQSSSSAPSIARFRPSSYNAKQPTAMEQTNDAENTNLQVEKKALLQVLKPNDDNLLHLTPTHHSPDRRNANQTIPILHQRRESNEPLPFQTFVARRITASRTDSRWDGVVWESREMHLRGTSV